MPKLQFGDDAYRIVGDTGEEGELAEYGEAATLDTVLGRLVAIVDKEGLDVISLLPENEWMIRGDAVTCEQEDVQFDVAGEQVEEADAADAAVTIDDEDEEDEEDEDEDEDEGDDDLVGDDPDEAGDDEDGDEDDEEVEELNPDQPRYANGEWGGGGSQKPSRIEVGIERHRSVAAGQYSVFDMNAKDDKGDLGAMRYFKTPHQAAEFSMGYIGAGKNKDMVAKAITARPGIRSFSLSRNDDGTMKIQPNRISRPLGRED